MIFQDETTKTELLKRLRRIEGQSRGVQAMIENGRDCSEILQQLAAMRSAIQSASLVLFKEYASSCVVKIEEENDQFKREQLLDNLITILGKNS